MAENSRQDKAEKLNMVQKDAIFVETVKKELKHKNLQTEFTFNPYKKFHVMADKPMSRKPPEVINADTEYIDIIHRAHQEPTKKYSSPQTESQEIGWWSTPLIPPKWGDRRFNFHRVGTDVTKLHESAIGFIKKTENKK